MVPVSVFRTLSPVIARVSVHGRVRFGGSFSRLEGQDVPTNPLNSPVPLHCQTEDGATRLWVDFLHGPVTRLGEAREGEANKSPSSLCFRSDTVPLFNLFVRRLTVRLFVRFMRWNKIFKGSDPRHFFVVSLLPVTTLPGPPKRWSQRGNLPNEDMVQDRSRPCPLRFVGGGLLVLRLSKSTLTRHKILLCVRKFTVDDTYYNRQVCSFILRLSEVWDPSTSLRLI